MKMKIKILLFCLINFNCLFSQNTQLKYFDNYFYGIEELTSDSAVNLVEIDSIFLNLFRYKKNQIEDIDYVIFLLDKRNLKINSEYFQIQVLESKNYLEYKLQTNKTYRLSKKSYRKIKKNQSQIQYQKSKKLELAKMLKKDQKARRKKNIKKIHEIDSINSIKVKLILKDSSYIKQISFIDRSILEILILHGGWDYYSNEIDLIHNYIENRYLNHGFFADIFERKSIGNGYLFKIENGMLNLCTNCTEKLCNKNEMYPSNTGNRQYFINGFHVFVPFNSNLSIDELNEFRRYCFLPKYVNKSKNSKILFPTKNEWCLMNNFL